ncbi:unnamed protein product, partial [Symbiodinium necroappetens]
RVLVDNVRRPLGDLLEEVLKEHQLEMQMEAQAQRSRRLLQSHFQRKERNENLQLLRAGLQAFEARARSRALPPVPALQLTWPERSPTPSHVQAMWQAMWGRTYVLLAVVVRAAQGTDLGPNWAGVNSFFAHALPSSGPYSRTAYLDKIRDAGLRVLRIFISQTEADYKNSGSQAVDDIETKKVGTYDDRILSMVDDLMLEAYERGIKLDIALHDRYSLGCWRTDAYVTTYDLPSGCCNCTVSKNQVDRFYSEPQIQVAFDKRLRHILQHRNPHFNAPWGQLHEVVASFAPENEAQGHDWLVDKGWWCRRAQVMKEHMHPDIPISTGGSIGLLDALYQQLYMCPEIDVVDIHTYTDDDLWLRDVAQVSVTWALTQNKRVRLQEFGSQGNDESKAKTIFPLIYAASEIGIPFMPWQLVHPESTTDYEFWTDGELWRGLSAQSQMAQDNVTVFLWPELNLSNSSMQLKADWRLCVVNSECTSGCCSNEFSSDRKYKCTPGGSQCTGHLLADWVWCTQSSECACSCCSSEYSDDFRYKCTPGGTPRLCGEALARNGQPCFENGNCRSGCCSSGSCVAHAPPFQCDRLRARPNWRRRLRRHLRRRLRRGHRPRLRHPQPDAYQLQLEDPMLLLQLGRQPSFVDDSSAWPGQGKSMPAAWRSASNEC